MAGLQDQERMIKKCTGIVEFLNMDNEFQATDDGKKRNLGHSTPSTDENDNCKAMISKGGKQKGDHMPGSLTELHWNIYP